MESRKAAIANFEKLDPKIAGQIKSVSEHPEMKAAVEKLNGLKIELAAIENKITLHYEGPSQASPVASAEKDAAAILAGTRVDALGGQSKDTELKNLHRQREALLRAIQIQESEIQQLECRLIREGCEELEPIARKYIGETIAAFEAVKKSLERQDVFFQFLCVKGYRSDMRPKGWQTTSYEQVVLFGGMVNLCSLDIWLERRKEVWAFDDKGKK